MNFYVFNENRQDRRSLAIWYFHLINYNDIVENEGLLGWLATPPLTQMPKNQSLSIALSMRVGSFFSMCGGLSWILVPMTEVSNKRT